MPIFGPPRYGPHLFGTGGVSDDFGDLAYEITRMRGGRPFVTVEHIALDGSITDISRYYSSGGNITREKERAPDEIQAGDFDITLFNHDNKFSEYKVGSLFYNTQYHGSKIRISVGFISPSGPTESQIICTGYIDELKPVANTMLALVIVVLLLSNNGFFAQLEKDVTAKAQAS